MKLSRKRYRKWQRQIWRAFRVESKPLHPINAQIESNKWALILSKAARKHSLIFCLR